MNNKSVSYYSIVHYVPDPVRNEHINIGVIVVNKEGTIARAKFPGNFVRARQFGREDVTFLSDFAKACEQEIDEQLGLFKTNCKWDFEHLNKFSLEWSNSIRMSEARASTLAPDELLEEIYQRFVEKPPRKRREFRDKRCAARIACTAIKKALRERYGYKPTTDRIVKTHSRIDGSFDQHEFDIAIWNEVPLLAAEGLSFEIPARTELSRDVDALAWAIDDIRKTEKKIDLGIIVLPPISKPPGSLFESARRIYEGLKAEFVVESCIASWAEKKAAHLPDSLVKDMN